MDRKKNASVAILISGKIDFKKKRAIKRDPEDYSKEESTTET